MSNQIRLPQRSWFSDRGVTIPAHVWQEPKFTFRPMDYMLGHEGLQAKNIDRQVQINSLESFTEDPRQPLIYGVGAEPSDVRSQYFAAHLVHLAMQRGIRSVTWHPIYGGFNNKLVAEHDQGCELMVLTGLAANSSSSKLEKARDILDAYSDIPRIVVIAGEDPITFFSTKLYHKLTHLYFFSSAIVKRKIEVV